MIELTRTVRFCVNSPSPQPAPAPADNTFAAYPSMRGLGRYYELAVTCRGEVDPGTGYFLNIKAIDAAVRAAAVPIVERACREDPGREPATLLPELLRATNERLGGAGGGKTGRVSRLRWQLTPYYSLEMSPPLPDKSGVVLMRQRFEFAASHRLHSPSLSDEQNRATYGKCNNPNGHGHNYQVEPCVAIDLSRADGSAGGTLPFSLADLERITARTIVDRYDHKHLNVEAPEFGAGGLNPSVENIARVCFERLAPEIAAAAGAKGVTLRSVTVWETDKTSCTYPG